MLHRALLVLVSVDAGDFFDASGVEVPDVEVAAAGGEEDARVEGMEGGGAEGCAFDVEGGEEWVCCGSGR